MTGHWFKPKRYGYGAVPANWKGWAATLAFCLAVAGLSIVLSFFATPALSGTAAFIAAIVAWFAAVAGLTAWFVAFCRARTVGGWRWRWGD